MAHLEEKSFTMKETSYVLDAISTRSEERGSDKDREEIFTLYKKLLTEQAEFSKQNGVLKRPLDDAGWYKDQMREYIKTQFLDAGLKTLYKRVEKTYNFEEPTKIMNFNPGISKKPDFKHWQAWFHNDEAWITIMYDFTVPDIRESDDEIINGAFGVDTRISICGLVDIDSQGSVKISAETQVQIYGDGNLNPPQGPGLLRSVCLMPHPPSFTDNTQGMHPIDEIDIDVRLYGGCTAETKALPGAIIRTVQHIKIRANKAWVDFSWNNIGQIYTPQPTIHLYKYVAV